MWTTVLSNKTLVEARYSGFYGVDHGDPLEASEPRVKPRFNDLDTGVITGGIYSWYDGNAWKSAVSGKVSHYAENFMGGSHDLKLGVQFDSGGSDYATRAERLHLHLRLDAGLRLHAAAVARGRPEEVARLLRRRYLPPGRAYHAEPRPALRLEPREHPLVSGAGRAGERDLADQSCASATSIPGTASRRGSAWSSSSMTRERRRSRLHAGRYYGGIVTSEFDDVSPAVTPRYLFDGTYVERTAESGQPRAGLRQQQPGHRSGLQEPAHGSVHRRLRSGAGEEPRPAGELRLQAGRELRRLERNRGCLRTGRPSRLAASRTRSSASLSDPEDRLFLLTNPDQMHSRYNGVSIQAQKRMSNRWQLTGSIVLSKSEGLLGSNRPTTSSATPTPLASQTATAGTFGQNPNDFVNADGGRLIGDRPFVGKLQFLYEAPGGVMFGLNYMHQDGRLYGRQIRVAEPRDHRRRSGPIRSTAACACRTGIRSTSASRRTSRSAARRGLACSATS